MLQMILADGLRKHLMSYFNKELGKEPRNSAVLSINTSKSIKDNGVRQLEMHSFSVPQSRFINDHVDG